MTWSDLSRFAPTTASATVRTIAESRAAPKAPRLACLRKSQSPYLASSKTGARKEGRGGGSGSQKAAH
eukprot:scaffold34046_cov69-Phaeocystis_antarctica.AAC.3